MSLSTLGARRRAGALLLAPAVVACFLAQPTAARAAAGARATLTATPNGGVAGSRFQVTLTYSPGPCAPGQVGFYPQLSRIYGTNLAPPVTMPANCTVTEWITAPTRWPGPATYHFFGIYQAPGGVSATVAASYTVGTSGAGYGPMPAPGTTRPTGRPVTGRATPAATGQAGTASTTAPATARTAGGTSPGTFAGPARPVPVAAPTVQRSGGSWLPWVASIAGMVVLAAAAFLLLRRRARRAQVTEQ